MNLKFYYLTYLMILFLTSCSLLQPVINNYYTPEETKQKIEQCEQDLQEVEKDLNRCLDILIDCQPLIN